MQGSIRRSIAAAGFMLVIGSSACSGDNPAGAAATPSEARMDGGVTFGSGGRAAAGAQNTMAADTGSTAGNRSGGVTFGSGG